MSASSLDVIFQSINIWKRAPCFVSWCSDASISSPLQVLQRCPTVQYLFRRLRRYLRSCSKSNVKQQLRVCATVFNRCWQVCKKHSPGKLKYGLPQSHSQKKGLGSPKVDVVRWTKIRAFRKVNVLSMCSWADFYNLIFSIVSWNFDPELAMVLCLSLPHPSTYLSSLLQLIRLHCDIPNPVVGQYRKTHVVPVCSVSLPLDHSSLYVGRGNKELEIRSSPWLNPFVTEMGKRRTKDNPIWLYRKYALLRPDLSYWINPVVRACRLVCDCASECACHARVLLDIAFELYGFFPIHQVQPSPEQNELTYSESDPVDDDVVVPGPSRSNETTRGRHFVHKAPGFSPSVQNLISTVRSY